MLCSKFNLTRIHFEPLLFPFWSLNIVHSSIFPKGWNNCLTSSSVCCLLSMPTKSFRSSIRNKTKQFVQLHFFITFKIQQKKFIYKKCTDLRDNFTQEYSGGRFSSQGLILHCYCLVYLFGFDSKLLTNDDEVSVLTQSGIFQIDTCLDESFRLAPNNTLLVLKLKREKTRDREKMEKS